MRKFKTAVIDPPWPYCEVGDHKKLTGYSTNKKYAALRIEQLENLPMASIADYLFLWTTVAFIENAYDLCRIWGFEPKTMLPWIKIQADSVTPGKEASFKPAYGVGYWFRGCVEPIIVARHKHVKSIRTNWVGLLCENAEHSRKPDNLYEIIESDFPAPYLELFGRRRRKNWTVIGDMRPINKEERELKAMLNKL